MSEVTLLPCPFCGGMARSYGEDEILWRLCRVQCGMCNAGTTNYRTRLEAAAAWNRRATLAAIEAGEEGK